MNFPWAMRGISVTKLLLLIPGVLLLALMATIFLFEKRKTYWDEQVREMCARDGGGDSF